MGGAIGYQAEFIIGGFEAKGEREEFHFECNKSRWSPPGDLVCGLLMEMHTHIVFFYCYSLCRHAKGLIP